MPSRPNRPPKMVQVLLLRLRNKPRWANSMMRLLSFLVATLVLLVPLAETSRAVIRKLPCGKELCDQACKSADHCRMGELEPWIDENFVRSVWLGYGEQVNVKMIRDKFSG